MAPYLTCCTFLDLSLPCGCFMFMNLWDLMFTRWCYKRCTSTFCDVTLYLWVSDFQRFEGSYSLIVMLWNDRIHSFRNTSVTFQKTCIFIILFLDLVFIYSESVSISSCFIFDLFAPRHLKICSVAADKNHCHHTNSRSLLLEGVLLSSVNNIVIVWGMENTSCCRWHLETSGSTFLSSS